MRKRRSGPLSGRMGTAALALALVLAACSPSGSDSTTSQPSTTSTTPPGSLTTASVTTTVPEAPRCEGETVRLAQGAATLIYAPIYVALSQGFFEEEGLNVEVEQAQAAIALQALTGGSVDYALTVSGTSLTAVAQGLELTAIQATTAGVTLAFLIDKDIAEDRGITENSTLEEKVQALQGLRFGYTSPGAASDVYPRWIMEEHGLDPDSDVTMIALGDTQGMVTAFELGQIDAFSGSPPTVQQVEAGGEAIVLFDFMTDVEETSNFIYSMILTTPQYLAENGDTARCLTRAVAKGIDFILDNPDEARQALLADFPLDPAVLSAAVDSIQGVFPRDGRMSEEMWQRAIDLQYELGIIPELMDATEGILWTNEYLR